MFYCIHMLEKNKVMKLELKNTICIHFTRSKFKSVYKN